MQSLSRSAPEERYTLRRFTDSSDYPCLNFQHLTKRDVASSLMHREENDLAIRRVAANPQAFEMFGAVYVIGLCDVDICKIGYSNNPGRRVSSLQTALWDDVHCHAVIWAPQAVAKKIECDALRLAKSHDVRLKGEWVALPPDEAVGLVLSAMDKTEAFTDSKMFVERWAPHNEELYRKGGRLAINLREQASLDAVRNGEPQPEQKGWLYQPS